MSKRTPKPSKKAKSPLPDLSDEEESEVEIKAPPAKKRKAPAKQGKAKPPAPKEQEATDEEDSQDKPVKAKRRYSPKKGTANYAFIVTLLKAHDGGEEHLTKAELMERADKSGLADKPIFGTEDSVAAAGFPVDGWTNFKTLKKNELVVAEGRPLRVHLTEEGKHVAQALVA